MASKHLWDTQLSSNTATAREQLGSVRKEWNSTDSCFKTYKYVQCSLKSVGSNGLALSFYDVKGQVATDDVSTASRNQPAGVCTGTVTDNYYAWIQIGGYHSAVDTAGLDDIADGDTLSLSATDGTVTRTAAGTASTYKIVGVAVAADVNASNTVAAQLNIKYGDIA